MTLDKYWSFVEEHRGAHWVVVGLWLGENNSREADVLWEGDDEHEACRIAKEMRRQHTKKLLTLHRDIIAPHGCTIPPLQSYTNIPPRVPPPCCGQ